MNSNRNTVIKFHINGKLDHVIRKNKGKSVKKRPCKKR